MPSAPEKLPLPIDWWRRVLRFAPIPLCVWTAWLTWMFMGDRWNVLVDSWFMTVTMCVGSFIAGATSEGGGAVAFPVMTLVFGIAPHVARDFALMIQSVGMTSAAVLILVFRIPIERRAILLAGTGGAIGIVAGIELIAPLLSPSLTKMFFTSLWMSFAVALYCVNRRADRLVHSTLGEVGRGAALAIFAIGILGGMVSGLTGSGLDILTFTLLTLFFRLNEKIATPTSVVLMASNALVGCCWSGLIRHQLAPEALNYWYACVPVVVVGAPLGAYFIQQRTRRFLVRFLYLSIVVQFLCALLIIPQTAWLMLASGSTLALGGLLFLAMAKAGAKRAEQERAATETTAAVRSGFLFS